MNSFAELKACPCCGSTSLLRYSHDPYDGYMGNNTRFRVQCNMCHLNIERPTFEEVTDAWNRRRNTGGSK